MLALANKVFIPDLVSTAAGLKTMISALFLLLLMQPGLVFEPLDPRLEFSLFSLCFCGGFSSSLVRCSMKCA
jgi:hypothetical protein